MTYRQVLEKQPHLRLININDVSKRLLDRTNGTCFIAFNTFNSCYELHSTLSFDYECNSCNAVIDDSWLNWKIIEDFLANNHRKFAQEIADSRKEMNAYYERYEEKHRFDQTGKMIDIIKRTLGRTV